jgi:hypothetical protein
MLFVTALALAGDPPPPADSARVEYVLSRESGASSDVVQIRLVKDVGHQTLDPELRWEQDRTGDFDGNGDLEVALLARTRGSSVPRLWIVDYAKDGPDLIKGPVLDDEWFWDTQSSAEILNVRLVGTDAWCRYKLAGKDLQKTCDEVPRHDADAPVPPPVRGYFTIDGRSCDALEFEVTESAVEWVFPPLGTATVTSAHREDRTMLVTNVRGEFNTLMFPRELKRGTFTIRFSHSPFGPFEACTARWVPGETAQAQLAARAEKKEEAEERKVDRLEDRVETLIERTGASE